MSAGGGRTVTWLGRLLINRNFGHLWAGFAVTNLGDGVMLAAGPLLALSLTSQPFLIAATSFVGQVPWMIFGLHSGVAVDRLDRRRIIVVVNLCRALVMALLALCIWSEVATIFVLYAAVFLLGTAETLADSAGTALVAQVVEPDVLGAANSRIIGTLIFANQLAGPPLGAFLFALAAAFPITLNAACLCLAALLVFRVRLAPSVEPASGAVKESMTDAIKVGIRFLVAHPGLRTLSLAILFMNITFMCAFSVWVLYVRERLGLSVTAYGLLLTAGAVGGIIGSLIYRKLEARFGMATLLRAGLVIETTTHMSLALSQHWLQAGITMLVFGCHATIWGSVALTTRQQSTPIDLMGRVNSVYVLFAVGGAALGALLGGAIAQQFSVVATFWVAFAGMVVTTVAVWRPVVQVTREKVA